MSQQPRAMSSSTRAISPAAFGFDQARHLLWRAGFGGTPEQVRLLASWGPEKAVDHLLNFKDIASYPWPTEDQFDGTIMREPTEEERRQYRLAARAQDEDTLARIRLERQRREQADRTQVREMQRWWLKRMIETPRPLEEKLTLFWHGHFATGYRTIENSYHMFLQNQLFRSKAAGNFGELLFAIVRDPAMLKYLDNDESRKGQPNENLARELMELFSLGVGNYAEKDIKDGARALTGFGIDGNVFAFRPERHDDGPKTILGRTGNLSGDDFVRASLEKRACAEFITAKLYRSFVGDIPAGRTPEARAVEMVVKDLTSTLLGSKYELTPMLKKMFLAEHFYDPSIMGQQIKSPVQLVVGAVRSLNAPVRDLGVLNDALGLMGQNLLHPPNVAGWSGGRTWINTSTLYSRQNVLAFLLTGKLPRGRDPLADQEPYDPMPLLSDLAASEPGAERDPDRVIPYVQRMMLLTEGSTGYDDALRELVKAGGGRITAPVLTGMLTLISAMPEYQLC